MIEINSERFLRKFLENDFEGFKELKNNLGNT